MKIHNLIQEENVYLGLEGEDVRGALADVSKRFAPGLGLEVDEVVEALIERESLGSTSVGEGFAIPHCKIQGLPQIAIALARLKAGVAFGSSDQDLVSFFFVVLSPPDQPAAHLQVLSQIARVLKRKDLRAELMSATSAEDVALALCRTAESEGL